MTRYLALLDHHAGVLARRLLTAAGLAARGGYRSGGGLLRRVVAACWPALAVVVVRVGRPDLHPALVPLAAADQRPPAAASRLLQGGAAVARRLLDRVARELGPSLGPGAARPAAGLLLSSVALLAAGLMAVAATAPVAPVRVERGRIAFQLLPGDRVDPARAGRGTARTTDIPPADAAPAPVADARTEATTPAPPPTPAALRGTIPVGKGMWIWIPERVEGGDPHAIVARAQAVGLTHVYVRTGSSKMGFYAQAFLDALLPVAHAHGLRVYGWDFPYLHDPGADVQRAFAAITYRTPDGHRIDGFAADIETPAEGTSGRPDHAAAYGEWLRTAVGDRYPLIAVVPRPAGSILGQGYAYAQVVRHFDAIAPMVYWMNREPGADVAGAMQFLAQFGKPLMPVGQAYDGAIDGGPPGIPSRDQLIRFMQVAWELGAPAVSFWSWQHADQQAWDAIRDAGEFRLPPWPSAALTPGMVRAYQTALSGLGFAAPITGLWDPATTAALRAYQEASGLPATGEPDEPTLRSLLTPVAPPLPAGV